MDMNDSPIPKDGDTIAVWFSCGVASAIAAKITLEKYGDRCNIRIMNNPIAEEHSDNRRFLKDVENWLGHKIELVINRKYPDSSCVSVWDDRKYMAGPSGAACTKHLKKRGRQQWESENHHDWLVLGFTIEEMKRHNRFVLAESDKLLPVLIDANLSKQDCFDILAHHQISAPAVYQTGMPNANCIGCIQVSSPTYWNLIRRQFPEIFEQRAEQSRRLGAKLVRVGGKRIFLDELDPEAKGYSLKSYQVECGIFCDLNQEL